jgi:ribose 5-phosphate isomerase RpiB
MGPEQAKALLTIWMNSTYEVGGRSQAKIDRIHEIESSYTTSTSL